MKLSPVPPYAVPLFLLLGAIAYHYQSYELFLYLTSYIHFFRFIHLYYYRCLATYEEFKRDAMFYKTQSQWQLFGCCIYATEMYKDFPNNVNWLAIAICAAGYFISVNAYFALTHEGTYYGIELGVMKPEFTGCWPYGKWGPLPAVWHPMYTGQIFAQLGLYMMPEFRQMFPMLVPVHIVFFVMCIVQELWDIHEGKPQPKPAYK